MNRRSPLSVFQLLFDWLPESGQAPRAELVEILQSTVKALIEHRDKASVTDWPFENFWYNPKEPEHSKLLGYFLDPRQKHGCGRYLLKSLIEFLKTNENGGLPEDKTFDVDEDCELSVEKGRIDILIRRNDPASGYAIIIENKINGAADQDKQLQTYVKLVKEKLNHPCDQIYVLYLPLTKIKNPNPSDVQAIKEDYVGVSCQKITFEDHILPWLENALMAANPYGSPHESDMRQNLRHYQSLLKYLINKQKQTKDMKTEIFNKLKSQEAENDLISWQEAKDLTAAATLLQKCVESRLRGGLLVRVNELLKAKGYQTEFDPKNQTREPLCDDSVFAEAVVLHVERTVVGPVTVCVGALPDKPAWFWIGYAKIETSSDQHLDEQEKIKNEIMEHISNPDFSDRSLYAWNWDEEVSYSNCSNEETAERLTDKLMQMYEGMLKVLAKPTN